jgi:hypothetical protein
MYLYEKEKDYLMDQQLNTTECNKCGNDMNQLESYWELEDSESATGYSFVCLTCHNKEVYNES